ncbi:MAG TPA: DUF2461 family protein, partial [Propionibacteriaceae bacterium]|nr:DUF2461 family protein [Propionibacteriaceae bacterium]
APRGYPRDHPRVDLLRQKAVSAHRRLTGSGLRSGTTVRDFVVETFESCGRMNDWIAANVGESQLSMTRR